MSVFSKEDVLEVFRFRSAIRHYDAARKVSDEDFDFILECGRLSPSSVGSEPWLFLVVKDAALRQALKPVSWGMATQVDDASHLLVILARKDARYDSDFLAQSMRRRGLNDEQMAKAVMRYRDFQEKDMGILNGDRALFDWCCKQCYIALGNMMTAAAMIGVDSCPIEGFDYGAVNGILAGSGAFNPDEYGVAVMATFGYRAKPPRPKVRRAFEDVVRRIG